MIELVQFPWSPYCLVQKRILEYSGVRHRVRNIPATDRSLVWKWTRQRYYQVPILKQGRSVLFETGDDSQIIAKCLNADLGLELFPAKWEGVQKILWRYIENDMEGMTFRLNDAYCGEFVPAREYMGYLRHKERKFGRGCIETWRREQSALLTELVRLLLPFEQMLQEQKFLLDQQPRFVDFDLWGMLANFLYSGHYRWPRCYSRLPQWWARMSKARFADFNREKLHS